MKLKALFCALFLFWLPSLAQAWPQGSGWSEDVLFLPGSPTLPTGCANKQVYIDTDATSGQRFYVCESGVWVLQGGTGTVAGSGTTNYLPKWATSSTLSNSLIFDDGTNVGIGSTVPRAKLEVVGNGKFSGAISTAAWTDPIIDYHCAGNNTATTGTISNGSHSLAVASASGWEVGMGIAVANAGSGGTTELITTVTAIVGTTFTLTDAAAALATTQAVHHDDAACLNLAVKSGYNVHPRGGTYNVTSAITFTKSVILQGDGWSDVPDVARDHAAQATIINNRGSTNNVLDLTDANANVVQLRDLSVDQDQTISPTAGWGYIVGGATGDRQFPVIDHVAINNTFGGIKVSDNTTSGQFTNFKAHAKGGAGSIAFYLSDASPAGNTFMDEFGLSVRAAGGKTLVIDGADAATISNFSTTSGEPTIEISDAHDTVVDVTFTNISVENTDAHSPGSSHASIKLSSSGSNRVRNISFVGGEVGNSLAAGGVGNIIEVGANVTNTSWTGLSIINGAADGISFAANAAHHSVTACNFSGLATGIRLGAGANNIKIVAPNFGVSVTTKIVDASGVATNSLFDLNVGIGTLNPRQKLDVVGTAQMTGFKLTTLPTTGYVLTSDSVGVGTWAPATGGGGGVGIGTVNPGTNNFIPRYIASTTLDDDGIALVNDGTNIGIGTSVPLGRLNIKSAGTTTGVALSVQDSSGNSVLKALDSGNVGIGTTSLAAKFNISGVTSGNSFEALAGDTGFAVQKVNINQYGTLSITGLVSGISAAGNLLFGALGPSDSSARFGFGFDTGAPWVGWGPGNAGRDIFLYRRGSGDLTVEMGTTSVEKLRFQSTGNVGIGTSTPGGKFVVFAGNAGIGTTAPTAAFEVVDGNFPGSRLRRTGNNTNASLTALDLVAQTSSDMVNGFGTIFLFSIQDNAAVLNPIAFIGAVRNGADNTGDLIFQTYTTGTNTEKMRIMSSGNVGIGTSTPQNLFGVRGNAAIGSYAGLNTAPTNGVIISGNVGIGTSAPNGKLITFGGNVGIGSTNPEGVFIIRESTGNAGWSRQSAANQACNTTCTATCMFGLDQGTLGVALPNLVDCADATADQCACAGSN